MRTELRRFALKARWRAKRAAEALLGWLAVGLIQVIRLINRERTADVTGWLMRSIGPWFKEHRIGRANLTAAFPDKSAVEIDAVLSGVGDNLGRVAAEFAHIDRLRIFEADRPGPADIFYEREVFDRFHALRLNGKPALVFAAHLANWELPALVASTENLDVTVLYRRPNIGAISDAIIKIRAGSMGKLVATSMDAPVRLLRELETGGRVAMLVDQHYVKGVNVTFFGRPCKANPLIAQLARHIDCPIFGTRVIRLPDRRRFRAELTEAIKPARDADGKINLQGTMQVITSVIEGWVREHPEQWLWLHRRWR
jgi:Kdo2-lipid IVA lauroyltransferase/acyltransferase